MISIKALGMYSSDFADGETRNGDTQIATDGKNFDVIDGGCDRYATRLITHLKSTNIRSPYLHISHCHYDHRDGINKILSDPWFTPRGLYCQDPDSITGHSSAIRSDINALRKIIDKAKSKGIPVIYLGNEGKIEHGEIKITVYRQYPKYSGNSDAYLNDGSLCYWFAAQRYLTTGDASMWCAYKYNLNPLIVKGGHHGNDMSADGYLKPSQMCPWLYKRGCRFYWDNDFSLSLTDFLMTGREDAINAGMTFIDIHGDIDMVFAEGKVTIKHAGKTYTAEVPYQGKMLKASWEKGSKGMWYRYPDGSWATGWALIDKKWYYFDADGWMLTGWRELQWSQSKKKNKKDWFFFDQKTGVMLTGWQVLLWSGGVNTFCFDENGVMLTGWHWLTKDGKTGWYYFENSGAMHTGWIFDDGAWYYLGPDGKMATGWVMYKGKRCYLEPLSDKTHIQGRCYVNCRAVIDGKLYNFDSDGYATEIAVSGGGKAELDGCDVASYQAGIDFSKMTTTDFAIIKGTQGTWYVNPYADIQYGGAKSAGKLLGMYHYAEGKDPIAEAQYFLRKVGSRVGECILALDWEGHDNSKFNSDAEVAWVLKFAMEIYRLTKVHIFLYMSKSVTRRRNWSEVAKDVRLWCAQYANQDHTDYKSNPWTDNGGFGAWKSDTIRQYSSKGRVTGYGKDLDINRAYMSKAEWLAAAAGKNTVVAEKPKTQWSAYVSMTTSPAKISNSGSDEHGNYKNGAAGDQTGKEWRIRDWYNYPWNCVLRHPLAEVRACLATLAVKAAENDNIGYDQNQRDSYGKELANAGYDPSKITKPVESDCSKGVIDNTKAAGYILGIQELQRLTATYTGNMRAAYKAAGFYVLTESKYLKNSDYLLAGDILLNDAHHTCTVITNGAKASGTVTLPLVKRGSTGAAVEELQEKLNAASYRNKKALEVDGEFGPLTQSQVIHFQIDRGLDPDGEVGPITWAALIEATK